MSADERTPLLPDSPPAVDQGDRAKKSRLRSCLHNVFHVENRILLAGFLISLSFSFTQVPYVVLACPGNSAI